MATENIDVDLYATREEALQAALEDSDPGDVIWVCRGDWASCPDGGDERCQMCARIVVEEGMTPRDLLARARPH